MVILARMPLMCSTVECRAEAQVKVLPREAEDGATGREVRKHGVQDGE